eukprot:COSAG02_NODE_767_length_17377_cov_991.347436_3_plen_202_part_00
MVFPALEERKMLCLYTGVRDVKTPAGSHDIVGNTTPSQGEHALEPDKIGGVNRSRQLFVHDNRLRTAVDSARQQNYDFKGVFEVHQTPLDGQGATALGNGEQLKCATLKPLLQTVGLSQKEQKEIAGIEESARTNRDASFVQTRKARTARSGVSRCTVASRCVVLYSHPLCVSVGASWHLVRCLRERRFRHSLLGRRNCSL